MSGALLRVLTPTLIGMTRILITGSRTWTNVKVIREAFKSIKSEHHHDDVILVSGGCPTGADRICELIAHDNQWKVERHPADWELYGKRAGFIRNEEMVRAGADCCLSFIKDSSRGSTMTTSLAEAAGIPTLRYIE